MQALRQGKWRGQPPPPLGRDPQGKVLGILGMGGIGRNQARKCAAFGMQTIYHNRRRLEGEMEGGAEYVGFEELLARSDVLSLNLPLNVRFSCLPIFHIDEEMADMTAAPNQAHNLPRRIREDEAGRHHR